MSSLFNLTAIAAAGATGSLCRYGLTLAAAAIPGGSSMLGTTIVNVLGCALLGGVSALGPVETESMERLMLAIRVGFLGSLTTFSTFASESTALAGAGRWGASGTYVLANLVIGWYVLLLASNLVKGWIQA
ncbi:CrcB family protein [Stieleria sp. TO1_6]|uniref:fluoride efflux transporter FluC n=1 Tax=Stieleria tagensis TaxID=2956795 RepID=UPI00209B420F|nr:CrcB family protein [Stieleria tagensis]MCO8120362.1 CrcB family protein [Stieleria tagensis]